VSWVAQGQVAARRSRRRWPLRASRPAAENSRSRIRLVAALLAMNTASPDLRVRRKRGDGKKR
jgi:hypothetical protein